jgi:regulator of sigma E protease
MHVTLALLLSADLVLGFDPSAVLSWILRIAVYLLVLGLLIVFHEMGHMIVAKRCGVTVAEFAFGFGPRLFGIERGGTLYTINLLPLGGFCRMVGEDTADDGSADPGNFQHKSLGARFSIILAGPVFNLILAAILFAILGIAIGQPTVTNVVQSVRAGTPAAAAGLAPGDEIAMLDGQSFRSGEEMVSYIHARPDKDIVVDIRRGGAIVQMKIKTMDQMIGDQKVGIFGFMPKQVYSRMAFGQGLVWALEMVPTTMALQAIGIEQVIAQHDASQLHGPVGIGAIVVQAEQGGISDVLGIAATMSVILGMFNLLPIPALDGGRLAFFLVELVRGRRVDPEKEGLVHLTGFALIMVFIAFVTYHDIAQLVSGKGPI